MIALSKCYVIDPVGMSLHLLAELGRGRLIVGCARVGKRVSLCARLRGKVKVEVPGAYGAVAASRVAVEGQPKCELEGRAFLQDRVCRVYGQAIHAESVSTGGICEGQNCEAHTLTCVQYVEGGWVHGRQARAGVEQLTVGNTLPRVAPHALN
jgi:hypothetical protein